MVKSFTYKEKEYKTGESYIFFLNENIIRGKLYISEDMHSCITAYLCHNNPKKQGAISPDRLGYDYSWEFYLDLTEEDAFGNSDVSILCKDIDINDKEDVEISEELKNFFATQRLELPTSFFEREIIFKQYNRIDISEKQGYLKLTDTTKNRFVDIKIGRFLTTLFKEINSKYDIDIINYSNSDIEKFHNYFISYQNDNFLEIIELKGEDILEGYKLENYLAEKSTLGGSCMTDKLEYLELYTKNPNIVSLLIIKAFDKIAGRCLVWNTDQGKVMDVRYTCFDWVISKFDRIRKDENYICESKLEDYPNCKKINITLDYNDLLLYPYVDTFKYINIGKGFITNSINEDMSTPRTDEQNKEFVQLTRTDGDFTVLNRF